MRSVCVKLFWLVTVITFPLAAFAAERPDSAPPAARGETDSPPDPQQILRAYLQLQEQLHATTLAIEQARLEAEASARRNNEAFQQARLESESAARRNADVLAARLKLIEETLTMQRDRELESMQKSNRFVMTVAGTIGGVGLVAILFTAFCLWRALGRVAQITASLPTLHGASALHATDVPFVTLNGPEMSGSRLLGAIERLEQRIHQLEDAALVPDSAAARAASALPANSTRVDGLLGKGQALLNANEPEKALACFEEVLEAAPDHAEALVKKGAALEQLKRLEAAIECYDKAIAVNQSMTVAYLHKGAVYNQLERFSEALECYEQALRTQQKVATA